MQAAATALPPPTLLFGEGQRLSRLARGGDFAAVAFAFALPATVYVSRDVSAPALASSVAFAGFVLATRASLLPVAANWRSGRSAWACCARYCPGCTSNTP